MTLGMGICPFGSAPLGFGTPASSATNYAALLVKPDGTRGDCCAIDTVTGDYLLDAAGNKVGGDSIPQMVYLALRTARGSSCVPDLGIGAFPATIGDNITQRLTETVTTALSDMIAAKLIEIVTLTVERRGVGAVQIRLDWRNLITGEIQTTFV